MAEFPLDPQLAKTLLAAETYGVAEQVATVCSMVSIGSSVFYRPKDKQVGAPCMSVCVYRSYHDCSRLGSVGAPACERVRKSEGTEEHGWTIEVSHAVD